ncbi:MAG: PASTA domain-containing protein [Muribaculaceae bacterium]|nr:PASTA domain-containing protein [Muribaculaceae bacterium]
MSKLKDFYKKHPLVSHIVFIIVAALLLLWCVLLWLDHWTMHGSTAIVPQVKSKSYSEAASILAANGLSIEISDSIYDRKLAPGSVVESWPKAGAVVKAGRQVYVTVTAFSPKQVTISMPLTGNVSSRQAMSYLRGIGISDIRIEHVPSEYADLVLGAKYGDTPITVGSVIPVTSTVTLSVGMPYAAEDDTDSIDEEIDSAVADAFTFE